MPDTIPAPLSERKSITAAEMRRRLEARFGGTTTGVVVPAHLMLYEITVDQAVDPRNGRRRKARRIDAVAVGLLRRTEWLIHGFEIKTTRADLLQELREPGKAAVGARLCDRWWLALGDPSILRDSDEIPAGWGVLATAGRRLRVVKPAEPMPGERSPQFIAALLHASQRSPGYRRAMGYQAGLQHGQRVAQGLIDAAYRRGSLDARWAAQQAAESAR